MKKILVLVACFIFIFCFNLSSGDKKCGYIIQFYDPFNKTTAVSYIKINKHDIWMRNESKKEAFVFANWRYAQIYMAKIIRHDSKKYNELIFTNYKLVKVEMPKHYIGKDLKEELSETKQELKEAKKLIKKYLKTLKDLRKQIEEELCH